MYKIINYLKNNNIGCKHRGALRYATLITPHCTTGCSIKKTEIKKNTTFCSFRYLLYVNFCYLLVDDAAVSNLIWN